VQRAQSYVSAIPVAVGLAIAMIGAAEAASAAVTTTLPSLSLPDANGTPVHCRRYWHCERVCKRRWYGKRKCREDCHSC